MGMRGASGGDDGGDDVRKALRVLSREIFDEDLPFPADAEHAAVDLPGARTRRVSGCDSADCLFCQYRSHSSLHLRAAAGKLTTLLRKRSLNTAALASLTSLLDGAPPEPSTSLLAAICGGVSGGGCFGGDAAGSSSSKRQRSSSANGITASAVAPTVAAAATATTAASVAVDVSGVVAYASATEGAAAAYSVALVGARLRLGSAAASSGASGANVVGATCGLIGACEAARAASCSPQPTPAASEAAAPHVEAAVACTWGQNPPLESMDASALPQPQSCVRVEQQQSQQQQHEGQRLDGILTSPWGPQAHGGWTFQPAWVQRDDPAPAALREVLRIPVCGAAAHSGGSGGVCGVLGSRPGGMVCALEFSPDGQLLAAGGVDKQVRLYSLSDFLSERLGRRRSSSSGSGDDAEACDEGGDADSGRPDRPRARSRAGSHSGPSLHVPLSCGGQGGAFGFGRERGAPFEAPGSAGTPLLAAAHRLPSKVSAMAWSPFMDGVLTVGDCDGVLLQLHLASGHQLADVEAHGGRKIWSVAHSARTPHLAASAADDRCARLWAGRGLSQCVAVLQPNPNAAVTCVDLSPYNDHLLALACADRVSYVYDMRALRNGPLAALRHHSKPAAYCRFMGEQRLATAATDSSLALWDLAGSCGGGARGATTAPASRPEPLPPCTPASGAGPELHAAPTNWSRAAGAGGSTSAPARVFRGHRNERNFVGLSVRGEDGLLACGSECSRAYAYHTSWDAPLASLDVAHAPGRQLAGNRIGASGVGGFVSAVCWQPAQASALLGLPPLLAAATSQGSMSLSALQAV